ncbi:aminotransferase class I/II-fold pyridoxal phosphate-dependent enzyme, partial [Clostridiaceae bacterium HSG29]|nr:aminotransferase class I/II-fold pyridoxal phosphate-dependent enzyme [Clostridiaceae bacterium HSG29]
MIEFNKIFYTGNEIEYIKDAMQNKTLHGDGKYSKKVCELLENKYNINKVMLLPSCTSALEMSGILLDLNENDEIIMPSYTFVSTANAFALRGCKIVFVDVKPDTMNISIDEIKKAITDKTKVVVTVNYGGSSINFDELLPILKKNGIYLIEDNAQGIGAKYKGKALGTIGDFSCISFHDTKNITSGGEGGAIFINNEKFIEKAEIIREKGTDRKAFIDNKVDKYSWKMIGSSYLMNE